MVSVLSRAFSLSIGVNLRRRDQADSAKDTAANERRRNVTFHPRQTTRVVCPFTQLSERISRLDQLGGVRRDGVGQAADGNGEILRTHLS